MIACSLSMEPLEGQLLEVQFSEGYDERVLRVVFEACFSMVMEVLEEEDK